MMNVQPMAPGTKATEYADIDTLMQQRGDHTHSNTGTLTSQNSTLRSKYQFLTLLEREELEKELREQQHQQQTNHHPQSHSQSQSRSSKKHTRKGKPNRPSNLYFYTASSPPPQSSPTDTVSSFEYQSQAQMSAMFRATPAELTTRPGGKKGRDQVDAGYESSQDESDVTLSRQSSENSRSARGRSHGHRRNLSGGSARSKQSSFKRSQLPDLALMTALPKTGSPSPSLLTNNSSPSPCSMMQLPTSGPALTPIHVGMGPYHTSMQLYPMQQQGQVCHELPPEIPKKTRNLSRLSPPKQPSDHSSKNSLHNLSAESTQSTLV